MMLAAALLALAAPSAAAPDAKPDEIVIMARKLRNITLTLGRTEDGRSTCGIDRSSGDSQLDAAMCRRAARCLPRKPLAPAKLDACLDRQRAAIVAMARKGIPS
ncbi:MAG TPA: hypothetical protein VNT42_13560 [Sphingomonas sp.]|nr:hypothetical protein [Sphingomonas sp.]